MASEHVYEKIRNELKSSLSMARTVDYYLIKLDSAIYMFKELVGEVDEAKIKDLLNHLSDIFSPLACHRDIALAQARTPRFPSLRRYYSVVREWLESLECNEARILSTETPSAPPVYLKEKLFRESRERPVYKRSAVRTIVEKTKGLFKRLLRLLRRRSSS